MELTVTIAGEAGQGIQTVGTILCKTVKRHGWNVFATQDYMSRVRGGCNLYSIRISEEPREAARTKTDILVALDNKVLSIYREILSAKALIIANGYSTPDNCEKCEVLSAPFDELVKTASGSSLQKNAVACGIVTGILHIQKEDATAMLERYFTSKGDEITDENTAALLEGYDYAAKKYRSDRFQLPTRTNGNVDALLNAGQVTALAALHAGCSFYSAYPMTPATGIMNTLAHFAPRLGIHVEQAEDEIAAINMVIGASFAGARAMTATSGGGFALMGEGLSLAAMTETPVVIVDVQRPGPATGFPTRTEQSDLDMLLHAGHGEFARVIYTPGSLEEVFTCTVKAFDTAEKYQIPVIIMTDQYLADSLRNVSLPDVTHIPRKRYIKETPSRSATYARYSLDHGAVSSRAIPGMGDDIIYADSDEHSEEGHITEDATVRTAMVEKRFHKKMKLLFRDILEPTIALPEAAELILLCFGSTRGVVSEAAASVTSITAGFIHIPQVWPFPSERLSNAFSRHPEARIVNVENNASGQLARLLRRETGIQCHASIRQYNGRPFTVDELTARINERFAHEQ